MYAYNLIYVLYIRWVLYAVYSTNGSIARSGLNPWAQTIKEEALFMKSKLQNFGFFFGIIHRKFSKNLHTTQEHLKQQISHRKRKNGWVDMGMLEGSRILFPFPFCAEFPWDLVILFFAIKLPTWFPVNTTKNSISVIRIIIYHFNEGGSKVCVCVCWLTGV